MDFLKKLCEVRAASGNEEPMKLFILDYVNSNKSKWENPVTIIEGDDFQAAMRASASS